MPRFRKESAGHAAGLRRPEILWYEVSGRGQSGDGGRRPRSARGAEQRWSLIDIGAMILAALQVILPFVLILLAATAAAYGLFMLAFGRGG